MTFMTTTSIKLVLGIAVLLASFPACSTPPARGDNTTERIQDFDFDGIKKSLLNEGLEVEVHGAVPDFSLYVVTLRDTDDFFHFIHMSLITRDVALKRQLAKLQRHDRIKIWGDFASNDSPQKHIKLSKFSIIKEYVPTPDIPRHEYDTKIPDELRGQSSAKFLVHAVHAEGKILVVEYKDLVLPIFVTRNEFTKNLYRNDKVILHYSIQDSPGRPTHLQLDSNLENPVEVYDQLVLQHNQKATLEGELILFPKSPQVSFDVWALLQKDADGVARNYTIVNFEDPKKFEAIRNKMAEAWKLDPQNFVSGRNKLIHNRAKVRATGTLNVVDPNQANPQIILESADNLEIIWD